MGEPKIAGGVGKHQMKAEIAMEEGLQRCRFSGSVRISSRHMSVLLPKNLGFGGLVQLQLFCFTCSELEKKAPQVSTPLEYILTGVRGANLTAPDGV